MRMWCGALSGCRWYHSRHAKAAPRVERKRGGVSSLMSALGAAAVWNADGGARYASHPLGSTDASLAFAVACRPVADPLARYRAVGEHGNDRLVEAHHQFWPSEEAMAEGNPQVIRERGEPVDKPPALIMQGTADDNLIPDTAANFAAAYTRAGARSPSTASRASPMPSSPGTPLRGTRYGPWA
jgi:acetyl esterase